MAHSIRFGCPVLCDSNDNARTLVVFTKWLQPIGYLFVRIITLVYDCVLMVYFIDTLNLYQLSTKCMYIVYLDTLKLLIFLVLSLPYHMHPIVLPFSSASDRNLFLSHWTSQHYSYPIAWTPDRPFLSALPPFVVTATLYSSCTCSLVDSLLQPHQKS